MLIQLTGEVLDLRQTVRVRRERPTALAWSIALAVTMLAVYAVTWTAARPKAAELASASPRVTRTVHLEALEGWCVALGAWEDAGRARVEAAGFAARGAAGSVCEADGAWRVLGALYDTKREADRAARKISDGEDLRADALPMAAAAVDLRITAPASQIELIQAADDMLREQVAKSGEMAIQLEKGRIQPEAFKTLCALAATEADALAGKLNAWPGAKDNALCAALGKRLTALAAQLNAVATTAQTDTAALSGMLRLAGIDDFLGLVEMRKEIAGSTQ